MFYFAEGWFLLRRTWWPALRLLGFGLLFGLLLFLGLIILGIVAGLTLGSGGSGIATLAITGLYLIGLLFLSVVFGFAWLSVVTGPYYGERRVWPVLKAGFANWPRMAGVWLVAALLWSPLFLVSWLTTFHRLWPVNLETYQAPPGSDWVSLLIAPLSVAFGLFAAFAGLNAVRLRLTAWQAWIRAFQLVPLRDWLRTVVLLVAAEIVVFRAVGALWPASALETNTSALPTWPQIRLLAIAMSVMMLINWYFFLCKAALWHRYADTAQVAEAASPGVEPGTPDAEAVPPDTESVLADAETVPPSAEPV